MTKFWDLSPRSRVPRRILPIKQTASQPRLLRHSRRHPPPRNPPELLRMQASLQLQLHPRKTPRSLTCKTRPCRRLFRRSSPRFSTRIRNCVTRGILHSNFAPSLRRRLPRRTQKTSSTSSTACFSLRSRAIRPRSPRASMICRRVRFTVLHRPCRPTPRKSQSQVPPRKAPQTPTRRVEVPPPRQQLRRRLHRPPHQTDPRQHKFRRRQHQRPRNRLRNPLHRKQPIHAVRHSSRFSIRPTAPLCTK